MAGARLPRTPEAGLCPSGSDSPALVGKEGVSSTRRAISVGTRRLGPRRKETLVDRPAKYSAECCCGGHRPGDFLEPGDGGQKGSLLTGDR